MNDTDDFELRGTHGRMAIRRWSPRNPTHVVVIAHGYAEHAGRYQHVAARLVTDGAVVYAPDHAGHGRSEGDRARFDFVEDMVSDLRTVYELARSNHPGLPFAMLGHSMGSVILTRYVQRYGADGLAALVLSGPVIGGNPALAALLGMDPLPDVPLDPGVLSRDPSVGEAYVSDPLVYHGPLQRESLQALVDTKERIARGGSLGDIPTLWIHGEEDQLAPLDATRTAFVIVGGSNLTERIYPGARHEVFNETNRDEVLDDVAAFIRSNLS